jgi:perosamine synthetase
MIKSFQIPLTKPLLSDKDIGFAVNVLKSGRLISGPVVEAFEKELASYIGVRYAICVSSGTAALHIGMLMLDIGPGDEVIVPAFSYPATANAVELVGAKAAFVDCEKNGFNIDTADLENKITSRTKAIIIVHNFGWPVDMTKVTALSKKYNLPVFEDAACALGSLWNGAFCGSVGHLAAFSFHPRKILTTGEGGVLTTNDKAIAQKAREMRNHGQNFERGINFVRPGFNYRMTEFQAAFGLSQIKRFETVLKRRRKAARYYDRHLSEIEFLEVPIPKGEPNYQTYVVFVKNRDSLIDHLKSKGVEAGIGTYSIPHTAYYKTSYNISESDFPNSKRCFSDLLSLPLFEGITKRKQDRIISILKNFAPKHRRSRQSNRNSVLIKYY